MRYKPSLDLIGGLTSFAIEGLLIVALGAFAALVSWIAIAIVG